MYVRAKRAYLIEERNLCERNMFMSETRERSEYMKGET